MLGKPNINLTIIEGCLRLLLSNDYHQHYGVCLKLQNSATVCTLVFWQIDFEVDSFWTTWFSGGLYNFT